MRMKIEGEVYSKYILLMSRGTLSIFRFVNVICTLFADFSPNSEDIQIVNQHLLKGEWAVFFTGVARFALPFQQF